MSVAVRVRILLCGGKSSLATENGQLRTWFQDHFVVLSEAEFFVNGAAELRRVEGDDGNVPCFAFVDSVLKELRGEAAASGFGSGVEVEEIGADGAGV